jgi:hypothetical protein
MKASVDRFALSDAVMLGYARSEKQASTASADRVRTMPIVRTGGFHSEGLWYALVEAI